MSGVRPYIDLDRSEFLAQQGEVLDVLEVSRYSMFVQPLHRNNPQQRYEAVIDDARLNDVGGDVEIRTLASYSQRNMSLS